jgi:hypothetical protein
VHEAAGLAALLELANAGNGPLLPPRPSGENLKKPEIGYGWTKRVSTSWVFRTFDTRLVEK